MERLGLGSDPMMQDNIPPPPPGFQIVGGPPPRPQPSPQAAARYDGPTDAASIMPALIAQESGGRAGVLGPQTRYGRAIGRTQMLPGTAREMAGKVGLPFDESLLRGTSPEAAAYQDRLGQAYLEEGLQKTGNIRDALMYYHGGPDRRLWGPKTQAYAGEVLARVGSGTAAQQLTTAQPQASEPPPPPQGFRIEPSGQPQQAAAGSARDNPIDITGKLYQDQVDALKKGAWVRGYNDEIYQLPGDAFASTTRGADEHQGGNVFMRRPNLEDRLGAAATAFAEQVPGGDEALAGITGALSGQGFDAARESQMINRELLNQTNRGARNIGGVAGAVIPALALPGAGWINGARGAGQVGRAMAVGTGYGAAYGFGNTDGDLAQRAKGAGVGATVGGVTGGALQGLGNVLSRSGARAAANPSDQRILSQAGVDLTPGQMAGGWVQTVEDAVAGTIPILGDSINAARRRSLESFDNVATNIALQPIGSRVANTTGRQGVRAASDAVSGAYNAALGNVTIATDQAFDAGLQAALQPQGLTPTIRRNLSAITDNILDPLKSGPVDGQTWKRADSQLGAAIRAADAGSKSMPEQSLLRDRLTQVRGELGDLFERTDPFSYRDTRAADRASATYRIVREASADVASAGREGNSSPATLNRQVRAAAGRDYGVGRGLLQDLSDSAMRVLPNTVPNSGSALRGIVGLSMLGGVPAFAPAAALPAAGLVTAGSAAYSRPAQRLLNDAYRAHAPGSARQSVGGLFGRAAPRSAALEQGVLQWLLNQPRDDQALLRGR